MAKVIIFGIQDFAELAHYYLENDSEHEVVAFSVNKDYLPENNFFHDLPIIPFENIEKIYSPIDYKFFAPMAPQKMNKLRENVYNNIKAKGYELISYVSSKATLFNNSIGDNCFILENNTIQPFTSIGNNVILWSGNHIGHHSVIKDHVMFTSHVVLSGHCEVESYCTLGVNSTIRDGVKIAEGTFVAMSASIIKNTESWSMYKGNPAVKSEISTKKAIIIMWIKKGLVFKVDDYRNQFIKSHASIPFAYHIEKNIFKIYFSSRNENGKSLPYYIDAIISEGNIKLTGEVVGPILELGRLGSFDDSGIMPSCLIKNKNQLYMYYIGWNPQVTVSYRLSIGLAISDDNGLSFKRYSEGPICDRNINEPYFNTAPFVIIENNIWKMWYISCTGWEMINNYPEPSYHIKYAESNDGINWNRNGSISVDYDERAQALGRPCVFKQNDIYKMYFSYRKTNQYRISALDGYKLGLALSSDGIVWKKKYEDTGIELSDSAWDDHMMEYCHVFKHEGFIYMLYNGNDFGKEGFGYAIK